MSLSTDIKLFVIRKQVWLSSVYFYFFLKTKTIHGQRIDWKAKRSDRQEYKKKTYGWISPLWLLIVHCNVVETSVVHLAFTGAYANEWICVCTKVLKELNGHWMNSNKPTIIMNILFGILQSCPKTPAQCRFCC